MNPSPFSITLPAWGLPLSPALLLLALINGYIAWRACTSGVATRAQAVCVGLIGALAVSLSAALDTWRSPVVAATPFGALLACGFLVGWVALRSAERRHGLRQPAAGACYVCVCLSALLGARVFHVVTQWGHVAPWPALLSFQEGGLAMNGALIAGVSSSRPFFNARVSSWRRWLDALASPLGIAIGLGHLGAYMHRLECGIHAHDCSMATAASGRDLHASAASFALSAVVLAVGPWRRFYGQVSLIFLIGYGIVQLSLERPGDVDGTAIWMTEVTSSAIIAAALLAWWRWHKALTFRPI